MCVSVSLSVRVKWGVCVSVSKGEVDCVCVCVSVSKGEVGCVYVHFLLVTTYPKAKS